MQTNVCPAENELFEFESGVLAAERFEAIAVHLDSCAECAARFEKLESRPDRIVEQLRERLPDEAVADDSELEVLVGRAAALQQTGLNAAGDTHADAASRRRAKVEEWVPQVLAPAEGPDEMGRLAGYRVLRVLGMGGMGVVLLAEDVSLKRMVALKVMSPKVASTSARARFLREAQSNAAVRHDNVVTIYQVGEDRGVAFLAMELLEGESLADRLGRQQKLSVGDALRIARETAQGLAAAHAKGLTHRDIKPDNIWLEGSVDGLGLRVECEDSSALALNHRPSTLNQPRVKLLDFGLARAIDDEQHLTQSGAIVGTPNYLSPEQAAGAAVDARTDLFSLGVVLFEMLSGKKPFAQSSLMATLKAIGNDPPRELDADIPAEVALLVKRLLEKRPEDRFGSCAEVIAAIERCQRPEPVTAVAPRKVKTNRTWIATAAAAALVLLFGVIITVKDKNGKTLLRYVVPDGGNVEVTADDGRGATGKTESETAASQPATKPGAAATAAASTEPPIIADHLPPMSPTALVQRPPKLVAKDGEDVKSWTVLPVGVQVWSASALSFDGQLVAVWGTDGAVRVWDVEKKSLHKVLIGHAAGPCTPAGKPTDRSNWGYVQTNSRRFGPVAWRPKADGKSSWLATASRDGSVRVWDVEKGTTVWKDARDGDLINMLAWSPDGTKLAVGYDDGQVRTWEADGVKELKSLSLAEGPPFSLGWSPDSQRLAVHVSAVNSAIGGVVVWNAVTGDKHHLECPGVISPLGNNGIWSGLSAMRWSPDGKQLALKGSDCLLIHDTTNWQQMQRLTSGLKDNHVVQDFDWSPDGTSLLVSWNGQLQMHDLKGDKATAVPLKDKQLAVKIEWAPGSTRVALWNTDGTIGYSAILDTKTMNPVSLQLGYAVNHEFSSDGTRLLTDNEYVPGVFQLDADKATFWRPPHQPGWSPRRGEPVWSSDGQWLSPGTSFWKSQEKDWARSRWTLPIASIVSWSPDSKRFLAYAGGSGVEHELWSPHDRKRLAAFEQGHGLFANSWSPDGSQFAMGSGGEVVVRNGASGEILRRWKAAVDPNEPGQVTSIAWSRRGDRMAVSYDSGAYVIDVADGKVRFALESVPATSGSQWMLWGPDDRRLLMVGVQELSVFDGDSGKYQTSFALPANSRAIHFLDQDTALCGTRDGFVHRLDLVTGKHEVVTKGLGNIIEISPDGQQLAVDHGGLNIHSSDGRLQSSFLSFGNPKQPLFIGADGHFWSNDQAQGPFWATKGSVPTTLVYIVQTANGQQTLTPVEFASRYGWINDPSQVRLK